MNSTEMTIPELREKHDLSAPEANGMIKSLEKLGLIKVVGERSPAGSTGKGRKSKVYSVPNKIELSL